MIDQDFEISVPDQFVTVDNDALFRCQIPPQARDFLQVVGWLEDGPSSGSIGISSLARDQLNVIQAVLFQNAPISRVTNAPSLGKSQLAQQQQPQIQQHRAPVVLPDGQLFISRVQLRDANKSFRCQVRNQLNGKLRLSSVGGRLFVTGK